MSRARGKEDTMSPSESMSPLYSGVKAKYFGAAVYLRTKHAGQFEKIGRHASIL
ncbi:hypothetical protein [Salibacterium halotolerans]|uniref:hypothetical protein n=1 Tax=Salibacterium halotolerans TaxID=1884432 RepID=UPI00147E1C3B|nr:hypothetical protein [Salibacterium halotolerans]